MAIDSIARALAITTRAQVKEFPTASIDNVGVIFQYVGETTSLYTNGYFYKSVQTSSGEYEWQVINVQPKGITSWGEIEGELEDQEDLQAALNAKVNVADIVNNVTSTDIDKPLAANQGKVLQTEIENLKAIGRYLSGWNCVTGLPTTSPAVLPYTYKTGDYFIISTVGTTTNYKPSGSTYTGAASTAIESQTVKQNDYYRYDGSVWQLEINTQRTTTWGSIEGDISNQTDLQAALDEKQEEITSENKLLSDLVDDTDQTHKFVTTEEKAGWTAKQDALNETQLAAVNSGADSSSISKLKSAINNQGIAYVEGSSSEINITWDGDTTGKQVYSIGDPIIVLLDSDLHGMASYQDVVDMFVGGSITICYNYEERPVHTITSSDIKIWEESVPQMIVIEEDLGDEACCFVILSDVIYQGQVVYPAGIYSSRTSKRVDCYFTSLISAASSTTHKISSDMVDDTDKTNKFVTSTEKTTWNAKSTVTVSATGTATDEVKYINIDGVEKKIGGGGTDETTLLETDLYAYTNIGKITASKTNPVKVADAGDTLKDVFNAILGTEEDTNPTISQSGTTFSRTSQTGITTMAGGEVGTSIASQTGTVTFKVTNTGTCSYGLKTATYDTYNKTSSTTFNYPIKTRYTGESSYQIKVTYPALNGCTLSVTSGTLVLDDTTNRILYCNVSSSNELKISINIPSTSSLTSAITRFASMTADVQFDNATYNNETVTNFWTYLKNSYTSSGLTPPSQKSATSVAYTVTAGSYYTYYKVTDETTTESTGWTSVNSNSIVDIVIQANAGQYIWMASTQNKTSIYEFNQVSGAYNTDPTATTKTANQTIHTATGLDVNTYYTYRTTDARSGETNKKFKLA